MKISTVLSLSVLVVSAMAACPVDKSFHQYSYDLCKSYIPCVDAFFLDSPHLDFAYFRVQLEIYMYQTNTDQAMACSSEELWKRMMGLFKPCQPNEVLDPYEGCKCRPDKVCDENDSDDLEVSDYVKLVIAIGLGAFFIYFGKWTLAHQRK